MPGEDAMVSLRPWVGERAPAEVRARLWAGVSRQAQARAAASVGVQIEPRAPACAPIAPRIAAQVPLWGEAMVGMPCCGARDDALPLAGGSVWIWAPQRAP